MQNRIVMKGLLVVGILAAVPSSARATTYEIDFRLRDAGRYPEGGYAANWRNDNSMQAGYHYLLSATPASSAQATVTVDEVTGEASLDSFEYNIIGEVSLAQNVAGELSLVREVGDVQQMQGSYNAERFVQRGNQLQIRGDANAVDRRGAIGTMGWTSGSNMFGLSADTPIHPSPASGQNGIFTRLGDFSLAVVEENFIGSAYIWDSWFAYANGAGHIDTHARLIAQNVRILGSSPPDGAEVPEPASLLLLGAGLLGGSLRRKIAARQSDLELHTHP